jgi:hypothetical protein
MEVFERNVATTLTTIISNIITITLLGINDTIKQELQVTKHTPGANGSKPEQSEAVIPLWSTYMDAFLMMLILPIVHVLGATVALCGLIQGISVGMPYKYIRLLSDASIFVGLDSLDDFYEHKQESYSVHIGDQTDNDSVNSFTTIDTHSKGYIDSNRLSTVWLPEYWPEKVQKAKHQRLLASPDKKYISDPEFDGMYCIKSSAGCLFGAIQCISSILISCMRLQNIDMVHTMDILSIYTSYILICSVISVSCNPSYYWKPVVCIPRDEWDTYRTASSELRFRDLRLTIDLFFNEKIRGRVLIFVLLSIPLCLIFTLMVYINRNNALVLLLSSFWIFATVFGHMIISTICQWNGDDPTKPIIPVEAGVMLGLLIALMSFSSFTATPEQKQLHSAYWLPHF